MGTEWTRRVSGEPGSGGLAGKPREVSSALCSPRGSPLWGTEGAQAGSRENRREGPCRAHLALWPQAQVERRLGALDVPRKGDQGTEVRQRFASRGHPAQLTLTLSTPLHRRTIDVSHWTPGYHGDGAIATPTCGLHTSAGGIDEFRLIW